MPSFPVPIKTKLIKWMKCEKFWQINNELKWALSSPLHTVVFYKIRSRESEREFWTARGDMIPSRQVAPNGIIEERKLWKYSFCKCLKILCYFAFPFFIFHFLLPPISPLIKNIFISFCSHYVQQKLWRNSEND